MDDEFEEHTHTAVDTPAPAEHADSKNPEPARRWAAPKLSEEDAALFPSGSQEMMDEQVSRWKDKVATRGDWKPVNTRLRGARKARREARERGEVVEEESAVAVAVQGARVAVKQPEAAKREKTSSQRPTEAHAGTRPAKKKERNPRGSIQTSPEDAEVAMIEQAKRTAQQQESHRQQVLAEQRERIAKGLPDPPPDTSSTLPKTTDDFQSPFFAPQSSSTTSIPSSQTSTTSASKPHRLRPDAPAWQIQKHALATKFTTGWNPRRKLSPDARLGIRDLHFSNPDLYTTPVLAEQFRVSPEAIRRILRSKWIDKVAHSREEEVGSASGSSNARSLLDTPLPTLDTSREKKMDELRRRWAKRYERIWDRKSELGLLPKRARDRGVEEGEEGRERWEEEMLGREVLERGRGEHVL